MLAYSPSFDGLRQFRGYGDSGEAANYKFLYCPKKLPMWASRMPLVFSACMSLAAPPIWLRTVVGCSSLESVSQRCKLPVSLARAISSCASVDSSPCRHSGQIRLGSRPQMQCYCAEKVYPNFALGNHKRNTSPAWEFKRLKYCWVGWESVLKCASCLCIRTAEYFCRKNETCESVHCSNMFERYSNTCAQK